MTITNVNKFIAKTALNNFGGKPVVTKYWDAISNLRSFLSTEYPIGISDNIMVVFSNIINMFFQCYKFKP